MTLVHEPPASPGHPPGSGPGSLFMRSGPHPAVPTAASATPLSSPQADTPGHGMGVRLPEVAEDLWIRARTARQQRHLLLAGFTEAGLTEVQQADLVNAQVLRRIVSVHGWPGPDLLGPSGASAAWQIALYADADRAFQYDMLHALHEAVGRGIATPAQWAHLLDRCRAHDGPQIYGTQHWYRPGVGVEPHPIEEIEHLDAWRSQVGLPPYAACAEWIRCTAPASPSAPDSQHTAAGRERPGA